MVRVLDSGSSGPGSGPGQLYCVVFLGKTLYSHGASLRTGVQMGTGENAGGNPAMDKHPFKWPITRPLWKTTLYAYLLHAE